MKQSTELLLRTKSWLVIIAFLAAGFYLHPKGIVFAFAFVSFIALKEYFTLIHTRMEDHRALLWSYLIIPIQYYWAYNFRPTLFFIFIPVYAFLFIPFRLLLNKNLSGIINSMAKIQWGLLAFVYSISHVALLSIRENTDVIIYGGKGLVLYLILLTTLNDIAQYVCGKTFGSIKISPNVSPNKTWEGFIGGVVVTVVLANLLIPLSGFDYLFASLSGLLISCSGFMGDLTISALKRDLGVKDSGNLLPGHGGILDRIDSLTYTAPIFYHFVNYFFY
jgi:phosphatidate cytidylyltransferase